MIPLDLLTMISAAAVFPYVAEAAFDWVQRYRCAAKRGKCTKLMCAHDGA